MTADIKELILLALVELRAGRTEEADLLLERTLYPVRESKEDAAANYEKAMGR